MTHILYYSPGTCSLAPHIVLREAGLPFHLRRVDLATKVVESGEDFSSISSKGAVPVLELPGGQRLSEGSVICQYVADLAGCPGLMPAAGSLARYRVMEWQNYISAELHKFFWPLFHSVLDNPGEQVYRDQLRKKFEWVSAQLDDRDFLTGDDFTAADAYLFTIARWTKPAKVNLVGLSGLEAYLSRIAERPSVGAALQAESLAAGSKLAPADH